MNQELAIKQFDALKEYADKTSMRLAAEEWDSDWKIIVAILMSAQTRDETTIVIADKLFEKFPTVSILGEAPVEDIMDTINSINYYKTKSKHIKASCQKISDEGISYDINWLINLPGVGRKTANVFLAEVGRADAIGVDTHVNRISNKLGWVKESNPDKVEQELMKLFPREYWSKINSVLVRFGKGYGTSRRREDEILEEIISRTK